MLHQKFSEAATWFVSTLSGVFKPNKVSAVASHNHIQGKFITCIEEKGSFLDNKQVLSKSSDSSPAWWYMRANSVIEIIKKDNISALFSPPESLELFYLCTVIEVGVAIERIVDKHNHSIKSGWHYVKCCYLEKIKEWKSMIKYKLYDAVCVLLTQVMNPLVVLNENLGSPSRNINGFQIACNFKD